MPQTGGSRPVTFSWYSLQLQLEYCWATNTALVRAKDHRATQPDLYLAIHGPDTLIHTRCVWPLHYLAVNRSCSCQNDCQSRPSCAPDVWPCSTRSGADALATATASAIAPRAPRLTVTMSGRDPDPHPIRWDKYWRIKRYRRFWVDLFSNIKLRREWFVVCTGVIL